VLAPRHLDVEQDVRGRPIEAYWRIPFPTLREVWPALPQRRRPQALRSWGALLRRVHRVKLAGHGTLESAAHQPHALADFLDAELRGRLMPSLAGVWPAAHALAARLAADVREVDARCAGRPVVLLHNDFHMGNVLCERRPRSIRCVGVIDLETAWAGPVEADVAQLQVLHGDAFGAPLPGDWSVHFLDGYASALDPAVLAFFRVLHRLNLGYFAASRGWWAHVADLEAEIRRELIP
jgi:aminoglycoside phosphotransferase (APT) family kinase protein